MNTASKTEAAQARTDKINEIRPIYLESLTLVERLHRRLLDVIKDEFDRRNRGDVNSVQALLLYNIGDKELTASELRTRGYYLGSNVSYNVKKLVEMGYLHHDIVAALYDKHATTVEQIGGVSTAEFRTVNTALTRLERFWTDQIRYRL
jgi:hypothetical protein